MSADQRSPALELDLMHPHDEAEIRDLLRVSTSDGKPHLRAGPDEAQTVVSGLGDALRRLVGDHAVPAIE